MDDNKLKELLQEQMIQEAEDMLEEVNRDPKIRDAKAPDEIHERLFAQIREYEANKPQSTRTEEEEELIRLGKRYKKRRKLTKYFVLAAVLVLGLGVFSVTSMGGPEKVFEEVKWFLAGREQTNIDTDSELIKKQGSVSEVEAYEEIEKNFNFNPVKLYYVPEQLELDDFVIEEVTQMAQMIFSKDDRILNYMIRPNYRTSSLGTDVEDTLLEEYSKEIEGVTVTVKKYLIEEKQAERWVAEFEYQDVQYILETSGINEEEIEKIIDNLYFS